MLVPLIRKDRAAMAHALVIRGRYSGPIFIPDEPLPAVEGTAEPIVFPRQPENEPTAGGSIFDLFGKARRLRSAEVINAQVREERDAWGHRDLRRRPGAHPPA
jgi:hypothetical protein